MRQEGTRPANWFDAYVLPGLAFKAVVIGGGYATGRELAEFFLPHGAWGGLLGMLLAAAIWSAVCALTFAFAFAFRTFDYVSFFARLLGRGGWVFEVVYLLFMILILSVFGAAAGAIGASLFGLPTLVGTFALMALISIFAALGNRAVEGLFKYVSILLYLTYAIFIALAFLRFGDRIVAAFSEAPRPGGGWAVGGATYASYNVVGAVAILAVVRHMNSRRGALLAGVIAGPLAMLPAMLFFIAMAAFLPGVASETLPSDFLLLQIGEPLFRFLFQLMIFAAILESGAGVVHAVNERIAAARERRGRSLGRAGRLVISGALLVVCVALAERVGLVALIANGYRFFGWALLAVYVAPLATLGAWRLIRAKSGGVAPNAPPGPQSA